MDTKLKQTKIYVQFYFLASVKVMKMQEKVFWGCFKILKSFEDKANLSTVHWSDVCSRCRSHFVVAYLEDELIDYGNFVIDFCVWESHVFFWFSLRYNWRATLWSGMSFWWYLHALEWFDVIVTHGEEEMEGEKRRFSVAVCKFLTIFLPVNSELKLMHMYSCNENCF